MSIKRGQVKFVDGEDPTDFMAVGHGVGFDDGYEAAVEMLRRLVASQDGRLPPMSRQCAAVAVLLPDILAADKGQAREEFGNRVWMYWPPAPDENVHSL